MKIPKGKTKYIVILTIVFIIFIISKISFNNTNMIADENIKNVKLYNNLVKEDDIKLNKILKNKKNNKNALDISEVLDILIPKEDRDRIVRIEKESDGKDENIASVESVDENGEKWILTYDPDDMYTKGQRKYLDLREYLLTLIHEYAHIIALNETQIRYGATKKLKGEIKLAEGPARKDSYIAEFTKRFWSTEMANTAEKEYMKDNSFEFSQRVYRIYDNRFVSEYAASTPTEDFAESFAAFVIEDADPNQIDFYSKKRNFFYEYEELVKLRGHIRKGILKIIEKSNKSNTNL